MSFESITQQTQSKYALRDTMKASSCAIEDWDSAVKLRRKKRWQNIAKFMQKTIISQKSRLKTN